MMRTNWGKVQKIEEENARVRELLERCLNLFEDLTYEAVEADEIGC